MAIDPVKFKQFRETLDDIIEDAPGDEQIYDLLIDTAFGDALRETENLIDDSRPPRLYVFGRAGAGKSSLINALSQKEVAKVGDIEPTTVESEPYHIEFTDRYATWDVIDSRGLFESVSPDGDVPADTIEKMRQDLKKYRPDVLIHVMTPDQVRAGYDDFKTVETFRRELGDQFPPIIYCLNKVDTHADLDEWPPEEHPTVAGKIKMNLDFVAELLGEAEKVPIAENRPLHGYLFDSKQHIGVVPLYLKSEKNYWNVDTLSVLIGDILPTDARLQFAQAQHNTALMRDMSRDFTHRFSIGAGLLGAYPTSYADLPFLMAGQLILVALIGGLSCREIELDTVEDYVTSMGATSAIGFGFRELVRGVIQFVPGLGQAISGVVAGSGTYAIGRSAEKYFFDDEIKKPSEYLREGVRFIRGKGDAPVPPQR